MSQRQKDEGRRMKAPHGTWRQRLQSLTDGLVIVVPTLGQRDSIRTLARRMEMPIRTGKTAGGWKVWRADVCNEFSDGGGI